jgi:hypothetical protein
VKHLKYERLLINVRTKTDAAAGRASGPQQGSDPVQLFNPISNRQKVSEKLRGFLSLCIAPLINALLFAAKKSEAVG